MRRVPWLWLVLLAPGCLGWGDILDRSSKSLPGGYCLTLTHEFNDYYIQDCSWTRKRKVSPGVGVLRGTITQIGWTDRTIVAWRASCCSEGNGFMIIDIESDEIDGPLSEQELQARRQNDSRLRDLEVRAVADVLD